MWNVCWHCGEYRADKIVDQVAHVAICPLCGYQHPFLQLPLMVITGASGSGKTTVCQTLMRCINDVVLLDTDILWMPEFDKPEDNYRSFFETWLRLCKNIGQGGRPVVLFGAGIGIVENLERCVERRYFSKLVFLVLTCSDEALRERLRLRPEWRGSRLPDFLDRQVRLSQQLQAESLRYPTVFTTIDTTNAHIDETVEAVLKWIETVRS